jgi:hypothetical protein
MKLRFNLDEFLRSHRDDIRFPFVDCGNQAGGAIIDLRLGIFPEPVSLAHRGSPHSGGSQGIRLIQLGFNHRGRQTQTHDLIVGAVLCHARYAG